MLEGDQMERRRPDCSHEDAAETRGGNEEDLTPALINHRAFDEDLVGISPDYEVRIASRLLEEEDGPMLDLLKKAHATAIQVPKRKALQPDRELLALRFDAFQSAA